MGVNRERPPYLRLVKPGESSPSSKLLASGAEAYLGDGQTSSVPESSTFISPNNDQDARQLYSRINKLSDEELTPLDGRRLDVLKNFGMDATEMHIVYLGINPFDLNRAIEGVYELNADTIYTAATLSLDDLKRFFSNGNMTVSSGVLLVNALARADDLVKQRLEKRLQNRLGPQS